MNMVAGLPGFEKPMLIRRFIVFVFTLSAITAMIVRRRKAEGAEGCTP